MRDRLKENIQILNAHNMTHKPVLHLSNGRKYEFDVINEIVEDVSLILEKMENGLLIELPCAVGKMIYRVYAGDILEYTVLETRFDSLIMWFWSYNEEYAEAHKRFVFDETRIGKTVFLTKEEAEEKLKEREKSETNI